MRSATSLATIMDAGKLVQQQALVDSGWLNRHIFRSHKGQHSLWGILLLFSMTGVVWGVKAVTALSLCAPYEFSRAFASSEREYLIVRVEVI